MIQQTDRRTRRSDASLASDSDAADGPEIWGNWAGHRSALSTLLGLRSLTFVHLGITLWRSSSTPYVPECVVLAIKYIQ